MAACDQDGFHRHERETNGGGFRRCSCVFVFLSLFHQFPKGTVFGVSLKPSAGDEVAKTLILDPEEWTTDNEMLTPSFKVKLRNLLAKHDDEIKAIA